MSLDFSTIIDIAAMRFGFPVTDCDLDLMATEVENIKDEHWYWCTFRECYLICLYGNLDVNNKQNMEWLPYATTCKTLINLCETFVFPMTTIRPRIIIIRTLPGMKMRMHTDCYEDQITKLEPKLRLVLKGREKNTLFYVNEQGHEVHIPEEWRGYMMSGSAIHGMNNINKEKYTLCFGDPWIGDNLKNSIFLDYFKLQHKLYGDTKITISSLGQVNHIAGIKDPKKEKIYGWNEWNSGKAN